MNRYENWLDDLNSELHKRGLLPVEELSANGVFADIAGKLAQWFELDRCGHHEAAERIRTALARQRKIVA